MQVVYLGLKSVCYTEVHLAVALDSNLLFLLIISSTVMNVDDANSLMGLNCLISPHDYGTFNAPWAIINEGRI
jgi:hypothetical protein